MGYGKKLGLANQDIFSPIQHQTFTNHCKTHMKTHLFSRPFGVFVRPFDGFAHSAALNGLKTEAVGAGGRAGPGLPGRGPFGPR